MRIINDSVVEPSPSDELIRKEEKMWRVVLPKEYKNFILDSNGGIPYKSSFMCNGHEYDVDRFLCILDSPEQNKFGSYDIDVVLTRIEERLTDNEDLIGVELLPIVQLVAGDYICLNYKEKKEDPSICLWSHEESGELEPVTYFVASDFASFLEMLTE